MLRKKDGTVRASSLFLAIAVVDSLAIGTGTYLDIRLDEDFYLAGGISIAGIALFIGLIYHALTLRKGRTSDGVRDAVACAFLAIYIILVTFAVFFSNAPAHTNVYPQTSSLLSSFTSIAAVVVSFYFATGSVDKFIERKVPDSDTQSEPTGKPDDVTNASDDQDDIIQARGHAPAQRRG